MNTVTKLPRRQAVMLLAGCCLLASGVTAKAAPQTFMIFFDWQRTQVTPTAKEIAAAIKKAIKPGSRVLIAGHCDTSESDPIALTRALEVQKELVAGLPAGVALTVVNKGTTELKVPTGPNVHNPVNRYVSITVE